VTDEEKPPTQTEVEQVDATVEQPAQLLPRCGFCGAGPFTPMISAASDGESDYRIYSCASCRAVITMGVIRIIPGAPQQTPLIHLPNGVNPTRRHG